MPVFTSIFNGDGSCGENGNGKHAVAVGRSRGRNGPRKRRDEKGQGKGEAGCHCADVVEPLNRAGLAIGGGQGVARQDGFTRTFRASSGMQSRGAQGLLRASCSALNDDNQHRQQAELKAARLRGGLLHGVAQFRFGYPTCFITSTARRDLNRGDFSGIPVRRAGPLLRRVGARVFRRAAVGKSLLPVYFVERGRGPM